MTPYYAQGDIMAWETRGTFGDLYYYTSSFRNGRVVKEYFGRGSEAHLLAEYETAGRAEREQRRTTEAARQALMDETDAAVAELDSAMTLLQQAYLYSRGCYRHRRQWRIRRGSRHERKYTNG